jgi:hypothetical protein
MHHSPSTLNAGRPSWPHIPSGPRITALRRAWQWLTLVRTDDPVRRVLNRGFAALLALWLVGGIAAAIADIVLGMPLTFVIVNGSILGLSLVAWWLNRRGSSFGALILALTLMIGMVTITDPATYAGPQPAVHVVFAGAFILTVLFVSPRAGFVMCLLQLATLTVAMLVGHIPGNQIVLFLVYGSITLLGMTALVIFGASAFTRALKEAHAASSALQELNADLEQRVAERTADLRVAKETAEAALANIKTLRGLLPICATCKQIRDDQGYWTQVEVYLREHAEVEFSHGMCPKCAYTLYPDLYPNQGGGAYIRSAE